MTGENELRQRAARLRAAAALAWAVWPDRTMDPVTLAENFRDEAGHRRAVDPAFLRAIHGLPPDAPAADPAPVEVRAWRAATELHRSAPVNVEDLGIAPGPGPLLPVTGTPIEIWTESELCLLHACWRLARLSGGDALRERCLESAAWHLENTQADNATNHPWAIHVFLALGLATDEPHSAEAIFHAEQLLHNTMVGLGRPDRLSAHILEDAAAELNLV